MKDEKYQCALCGKTFPADQIQGMYPADDSIVCKSCFGHSPGEKCEHAGAQPSTQIAKGKEIAPCAA